MRDKKQLREATGDTCKRAINLYRVDEMVTAWQKLSDRSAVAIS